MSALRLSGRPAARVEAELLVLPCWAGPDRPVLGPGADDFPSDPSLDVLLAALRGFGGRSGELTVLAAPGPRGGPTSRVRPVMLVGLGDQPGDQLGDRSDDRPRSTVDQVRDAAQLAAGEAVARGYRTLATTLPQASTDSAAAVRATVEGLLLGGYRPGRPTSRPLTATLLVGEGKTRQVSVRRALETGQAAAAATNWVRRLVTLPPGELTPDGLAEEIASHARSAGVRSAVWRGATLRDKGFGGVVGVGAGSRNRPCVVELRAGAGPRQQTWGLAGKGITFDSGGLNLKKDPHEISWMKSDMAAAAAVAAATVAATELGASAPVRAVLPLAENLPGGSALRPGDVVQHPDGRRTEVTDTDCEGRLVLADALAHLARQRPAALFDVGTLTDGGGVGDALWGCWSSDHDLAGRLLAAGAQAGEPGWQLPLRPEYAPLLASDVADLVNCPTDAPDSGQLAATYLRHFTGDLPWVHVDNGSSAYLERARAPWPKGATGSPTRALLELLMQR